MLATMGEVIELWSKSRFEILEGILGVTTSIEESDARRYATSRCLVTLAIFGQVPLRA